MRPRSRGATVLLVLRQPTSTVMSMMGWFSFDADPLELADDPVGGPHRCRPTRAGHRTSACRRELGRHEAARTRSSHSERPNWMANAPTLVSRLSCLTEVGPRELGETRFGET